MRLQFECRSSEQIQARLIQAWKIVDEKCTLPVLMQVTIFKAQATMDWDSYIVDVNVSSKERKA